MGYDVRADIAAIMATANAPDTDPAARFALISTLSRYQEQLRQLAEIKSSIDEHGAMLTMKDSYGRAVVIENPAVRSYARTTQQANATAGKLLKLYNSISNSRQRPPAGGGKE